MTRRAVLAAAVFVFVLRLAGTQAAAQAFVGAALASPSPDASSSSPPITRVDGAFSLPGGVWNCETLANASATSIYKLEGSARMVERTKLILPKRAPVELDTTFIYDRAHDLWHLSMQDGAYVATAPSWSTETWTFTGTETDGAVKESVRLVYTSLGVGAYRSDYQSLRNGGWQTFSGATCKRIVP